MDQSTIIVWALGYSFAAGFLVMPALACKKANLKNLTLSITAGYFAMTSLKIMMELFP